MIALGFLEEIERILRERYGRPDLCLCDYFDLIGGTSAGALVASALATGMEAKEVVNYGMDFAEKIFGDINWRVWKAIYDDGPLVDVLTDRFGDLELGDPSIRSGLCIITKRADTGSVWPLINHPDGRFYEMNKHILLRNAIRASTAAPVYFAPIRVDVGDGQEAAFVDGGVSMANNPSLQLFMLATLSGYPFHWQTGDDRLLLTSIGTGSWQQKMSVSEVLDASFVDWAMELPHMFMMDANMQNQLLLQWISKSPTRCSIDADIGDLSGDLLTEEPLLHYLRYNVRLDANTLREMDLSQFAMRASDYYDLTSAEYKDDMLQIGRASARRQVRPDHFPEAFDLA